MNNINAILTIAYRDVMKFLRDRTRIIGSAIFPILFVGVLGTSLQSSLGQASGQDLLTFTFLGVIAQTLFQSTAAGIISLIEDRENDFSQEMFISPVSRYAILFGKILGESIVSFLQLIGVIIFGFVIGVKLTLAGAIALIPVGILIALFGGAFGILVLSNLSSQRAANQIFPFIIFPQLFLAGVFTPVTNLPLPLLVLSRIAPLTYAVDLLRGVHYGGKIDQFFIINTPATNLAVIVVEFVVFLVVGTLLFVRNERNR